MIKINKIDKNNIKLSYNKWKLLKFRNLYKIKWIKLPKIRKNYYKLETYKKTLEKQKNILSKR